MRSSSWCMCNQSDHRISRHCLLTEHLVIRFSSWCYVEEQLVTFFLSLVCFPLTEELVLEESPKWRLVSEVLAEIERDDADNDKCTCYPYCLYFVWLSVIFTSINDFKLLLRLKRSYRRSLSIPIFFLGKECRAKYFLPMFKTGQCFKLWKDEEKILFRRSLSNALRITYIFNCLWKKYLISEALQFSALIFL